MVVGGVDGPRGSAIEDPIPGGVEPLIGSNPKVPVETRGDVQPGADAALPKKQSIETFLMGPEDILNQDPDDIYLTPAEVAANDADKRAEEARNSRSSRNGLDRNGESHSKCCACKIS